ncbi:GNAT family N-acetyltransferase [Arthrobacter sp. HLT1-21]
MARLLARVAPWLPSVRSPTEQYDTTGPVGPANPAPSDGFATLGKEHNEALGRLVERDPTANVFIASHLEASRGLSPSYAGGEVIGIFRDGELVSACWAGVNLVPIAVSAADGAALGTYLGQSTRKFSSIFGPSEAVLAIWSTLQEYSPEPFDVRPAQPLLAITGQPKVEPAAGLRFTREDELDVIVPACAAMFEEEVGYSPFTGGGEYYRRRVASLVRRQASLADFDDDGQVIFKAELGTVSSTTVQIQGVWMNPAYRGQGLSAGYLAAVVLAAQQRAPVVSLYVNSFNTRALAAYRTVGFSEVGTFATVLL